MKHPALARVFAIVLAIVGLILLAVGVRGLKKAESEREERAAYAEKFSGWIADYRALHAELENAADYDETMAALEALALAHEKTAGQHKTDTALYTATKGGLKMGEEAIAAARQEIEETREQLADAETRQVVMELLISEMLAQQENLPNLAQLAQRARGYAGSAYAASAQAGAEAERYRALLMQEPQPPEEPVPPPEPQPPEPPAPMEGEDEATEPEPGAYEAAYAAYEEEHAAWEAAFAAWETAHAAWEEEFAAWELAHSAWEETCRRAREESRLTEYRDLLQQLSAALAEISAQAEEQLAAFSAETGETSPELWAMAEQSAAAAAQLNELAMQEPALMSDWEFLTYCETLQELGSGLGDSFSTVAGMLENPAHTITEIIDALNMTQSMVDFLNYKLDQAEAQLHSALAELWYQAGELDKDQLRLEAEKLGLSKEAELLSKRTLDADELKDLRGRHNAVRLKLVLVPEVKSAMTDEESLPAAAESYLESYESETDKLWRGRRVVNALAIASGAMGVLGVPAAYELLKKRFWLLTPVLLCIVCAAAAEALHVRLGLGQMYAALSTALIAFLQLLIVLPRKRRARAG